MSDLIKDNIKQPNFEIAIRSVKERFLQITDESVYIKEIGFAIQQIKGNRQLQTCDGDSIQDAILNIARTGASLNPILKQAYLIPRKGKCCLDLSYIGMIKLAVDSGSVFDMDATCVFSNDEFFYEMGLEPKLKHVPSLEGDRGEFIFVYAVAILSTGIRKFIVLNKAEIEKIRKCSQAPDSPMWKDFYEEGCRKTVIKKLYKLLPQTDKLSNAIWVVNQHEGIDFEAIKETNAQKLMDKFKKPEETVTIEEPPQIEKANPKKTSKLLDKCYKCSKNDDYMMTLEQRKECDGGL